MPDGELYFPRLLALRLRVTFQERVRRSIWLTDLPSDSDPAVLGAALRSPRLLPHAVERASRRPDLPVFALRMILEHPRWSVSPRVRHNLALNPRTPFADASRLLRDLTSAELERATRCRQVTPRIAVLAAEILRERTATRVAGEAAIVLPGRAR